MTKTITFLFATSLLFTVACDSAEEPVTERSGDIEAPAEPCDDAEGHHGKRGDRAQFAAEKLCSELECTEDQATKVTALFASQHEGRDEADREAHKAARKAADKALADAFRAESFDPAVLEQFAPERDGTKHQDHMIAVATELHAILTPAQRATLADRIAERGPMFFAGHGGKDRGHGGKDRGHGDKGPERDVDHGDAHHGDRLARQVDGLCEKVTCTEGQQVQLTQTLEGVRAAHRDGKEDRVKPDFSAVADAFRADTLDAAALRAALEAAKPELRDHGDKFGAVAAQIHDILTPEQREIIATMIESDGLRAVMGGGKHGKRGEGKRDRQG